MQSIRVLERAMAVLRVLERRPGCTLADLHRETRLPKPTLLRLLATLEAEHVIWRALADGTYRTSIALRPPSATQHKHYRLAEAAAAPMMALRRRVIWPSDLTVRQGYAMELIETSRRESSLLMHRDALGFRIDMLLSAVGRAYLAFCPEVERAGILAYLDRASKKSRGAAALNPRVIDRMLMQTRERGYGVRDPSFGGIGRLSEDQDDKLAAIAVPILSQANVLGCINIVWPRRLHAEREVARKYLKELQRAASAIAVAIAQD